MALDPLTAILNIGDALIDRLLPDKAQAAAAKAQLVQMQVQGELAELQGQLEINKVEAASNSIFVAGWRPFIGWVCGGALIFDTIVRPMLNWISALAGHALNAPALDMATLLPLLGGLLGFGAMRSYDKLQGNDNGH